MSRDLKGFSLYDDDEAKCGEGQADRQTSGCHSIKERDPSLVGKEWASLAPVNLEALGVSTYDGLFEKQVCSMPRQASLLAITSSVGSRLDLQTHQLFRTCTDYQEHHGHASAVPLMCK